MANDVIGQSGYNYTISYGCIGNGTAGICKSRGYPTYNFKTIIDYTDMSLKVVASSNNVSVPIYRCGIDGWLTVSDLTMRCVGSPMNNTILPNILYCSGNGHIAICV